MNHPGSDEEDSVLIRIAVTSPDDISLPDRRIILTEKHPSVEIGRSSNRPALALQPAVTNGWFDSPVMSRHHAEIRADIRNKAVTLRDSGSMHGTYLNNAKISSEKTLRAEDEIILGVPVYRNEHTFQPATLKVERVEFRDASCPTTSPNRVFTVPDDCSTDDNDPMDESMDDLLPSSSKEPVVIDLEENPWDAESPPSRPRSTISRYDGPDDVVQEPADSADPVRACHSDVDEGSIRVSDGDDSDGVDEDHDDHDDMSSMGESSVDSLDMSNNPHDTNYGVGSRSPSWNSMSTDSTDELFGDDYSEHHSSVSAEDAEAEEDLLVYDTETDELDATGIFDEDRLSEPEPELLGEPRLPHSSSFLATPPRGPRLPPIDSVLSPGPWGLNARPKSFETLTSLAFEADRDEFIPRLPSPSDVVLPHSSRPFSVDDRHARNYTQGYRNAVEMMVSEPPDDHISSASLGEKTGKPDFFEARERNKLTLARSMGQRSWPVPTSREKVGSPVTGSYQPCDWKAGGIDDEAKNSESGHWTSVFNWKDASNDKEPGDEGNVSGSSAIHHLVPQNNACESVAQMPANVDECGESAWQNYLPSGFPASAYGPQQLEKREQYALFGHHSPGNTDAVRDENDGVQNANKTIDTHFGPQAKEGLTMDTPKDNKGKRKAAEISQVSEAETASLRYNVMDAITEAQRNDEPVTPPEAASPVPPQSPRPTRSQPAVPSPPTTREDTVDQDDRPSKRMKKIAERVGFAALGGATVGAMVLTSLIYTAPTFV